KAHFIGKDALVNVSRETRLFGIICPSAEPHIGAEVEVSTEFAGVITAGAFSPFLKHGIGYALMDHPGIKEGSAALVGCIDGNKHDGTLTHLPFYDPEAEIPRGKRIDIPERT
ncbi:MAG TPA: hypothetical protein DHW07_02450, partial [Gammaproteobacteria bacterium]|nr:hypothetical protein [Gammaproteobacteria bacterium]